MEVIREYFDLNHAEPEPAEELDKPFAEVYYFPMQAVWKEISSTSKIRVEFDVQQPLHLARH